MQSKRFKLQTLKPRLVELDPIAARGIKYLHQLRRPPVVVTTDRWTKAGNGRLLPLNSAAWRKLRANVLAGEPLCRHCTAMGLNVPATEVDHQDNNPANNDPANLCPLCKPCHSRKTARDMGGNVRMGCDVHGTPLDHNHPWSNAATGVVTSRGGVEKSPATHKAEPYVPLQFNAKCNNVP